MQASFMSAVCASTAWYVASPVATFGSLLASCFMVFVSYAHEPRAIRNELGEDSRNYWQKNRENNLPQAMDELAKTLSLSHVPTLLALPAAKQETDDEARPTFADFRGEMNAKSMPGLVILTRPFLECLKEKQQKWVLAHELGHETLKLQVVIAYLIKSSTLAIASWGMIRSTWQGDIANHFLAAATSITTAHLASRNLARTHEYHADRLALQATGGDIHTMRITLEKLREHNGPLREERALCPTLSRMTHRFFPTICNLFSDHPSVDRRCARASTYALPQP